MNAKRFIFVLSALGLAGLYVVLTGDVRGGYGAMALVTGPLFSMEASGTLGGQLTYDRRGFVRQHVIPANPQSDLQGNARQKLLAVQKALTKLGATVITALRTIAPTSYRWNSYMVAQVIGANSSEFDASVAAFAALTGGQRTSWDGEGTTAGLVTQTITYATDTPISPGLQLFAVSRTLFALGFNTGAGTPGAANFVAWEAYFVS